MFNIFRVALHHNEDSSLDESLLEEQPRGLNSKAMYCSHCKFEINEFYCFVILSTF